MAANFVFSQNGANNSIGNNYPGIGEISDSAVGRYLNDDPGSTEDRPTGRVEVTGLNSPNSGVDSVVSNINHNLRTRGGEGHIPQQRNNTQQATSANNVPNQSQCDDVQHPMPVHSGQLGMKKQKARMKVATLNIRGGGSQSTRGKWTHVNQIMRDKKIAILAVQETHLSDTDVESLHQNFPGRLSIHNSSDPDQPNARLGVAIVLNKQLTSWKEALVENIIPGRAVFMRLPWQKQSLINVLAIYAPNNAADNADFWNTLNETWTTRNLPLPDVMLGDFNLVEEAIDRLPAHRDSERATTNLQTLKETLSLQDRWRICNPTKLAYTFTQDATQSRSRIDRIYTSMDLKKDVRNWQTDISPIKTDHAMVSVEISNPGAPWIGKGRWAIPAHILKQRKVLKEIKERGMDTMEKIKNMNPQDRDNGTAQSAFASFKRGVIVYAKAYAKVATPVLDQKIEANKKALNEALNSPNSSIEEIQTNAALIEERIKQLEALRHTKIRDHVAVKGTLEGEQIGKFWIQANKEKKPRDTIHALRTLDSPADNPVFEQRTDRMAQIAHDYHSGLQTEGLVEGLTDEDFAEVLNHLKPTVSQADKANLAKYITRDEVEQAIKDLPEGKAPGPDGIPHELWKILNERFKSDRKHRNPEFDVVTLLKLVYNDIEQFGVDPELDFSDGWMCPIYKKGETTEISNYRPITILNSDYKMMTRVLTTRVTQVVPYLIHPDQAGFMKGRSIADQTDLTRLMLDKCEAEEKNGVIVCLDQEKAYDKIRHDFIWKTLKKLDFPNHFTRTVKSLYENGRTVVIINGVISKPYIITRGVRQGDPLSCLIFNLAIEPLAQMLRDSNLKGFEIPGERERLITTLFADDTTVYLSEEDQYSDLIAILNKWCRVSGAKFNIQKTVVLPMGTEEYRHSVSETRRIKSSNHEEIPPGIVIARDGTPVRVLGAFVGNRTSDLAIWTPTIEKINRKLKNWAKGRPTLEGKRLIIGMEVGGLTQYLARVQGMTKEVERTITKVVHKFIWDDASSMVNIETLQAPITQGGKGLLDIEARNKAIDIMRLKSYLNLGNNRPRWAKIADEMIVDNIPVDTLILDEGKQANIFTQSWHTKVKGRSTLPEAVKTMLKTAAKYNVQLEPVLPSHDLKREINIWHHKGVNPDTRSIRIASNKWAKCHRQTHNIKTAGQMTDFAMSEHQGENNPHRARRNCACPWCKGERRKGCENPHLCRLTARKILDSLHPKWDPRIINKGDDLDENETTRAQNELAKATDGPITFVPTIESCKPCWAHQRTL